MWPGCSEYGWMRTCEYTVSDALILSHDTKGVIFSVGEAFEQKTGVFEVSDPRDGCTGSIRGSAENNSRVM